MKRNSHTMVKAAVVSTGISSVVTQLVIIREFLVLFTGNEFVIALIFFNWLILGGTGTLACRWSIRRIPSPRSDHLGRLSIILVCTSILQIPAVRTCGDLFFVPGSSIGFYPILIYSFVIMMPYSLLVGFALPYSLFIIQQKRSDYKAARIYIADNAGDAAGAVLFSFVLVYVVTPVQALVLANLPLLIIARFLFPPENRRPAALFICPVLVLSAAGLYFESFLLKPTTGRLVYYRESPFGRITVHQDQDQFTLFADGSPRFNADNLMAAEEAVHYPMSQTNKARQILLISAQGGMLKELNKYHPKQVDYIELDQAVTDGLFAYGLMEKIPALNLIHQDARAYLSRSKKRYDALMISLPEPNTFQVNRFYTDYFFYLAESRLAENGILSFSMKGYDNYLAEERRQTLSSLYNTAKRHFQTVLLLPGQQIFFLCKNGPIDADIPQRLQQKGIETDYIRFYYHGNLTDERIVALNRLMDPSAPVNQDLKPHLIRLMLSEWFAEYAASPSLFFTLFAGLCLIYTVFISREEFVLFSTGCMNMGSEIIVVFAFQVFLGYIYLQIGLIVTFFLLGLLPGAWLGSRVRSPNKAALLRLDGLCVLLMLVFILLLSRFGHRLPAVFYLIFGFAMSLVCGCQFPVVLSLQGERPSAITGIFSADLLGAAFGALMTSVVFIPHFGIQWAAFALTGLKATGLILMVFKNEKNQSKTISVI